MFFTSYAVMDKMLQAWASSGLLDDISSSLNVRIFFEPKNGRELDDVISSYYHHLDSNTNTNTNNTNINSNSAILFAVCKGKISEGIDFRDHYARAVVVIGIIIIIIIIIITIIITIIIIIIIVIVIL